MRGVPYGESGSPRTDRLPDTGGQEPPAGGQQEGTTRLGFALMLKFFELEARFPRPAQRHLHQRHVGERGVAYRLDVVPDASSPLYLLVLRVLKAS